MTAPAVAVLDAVIDEWLASFPGTPERQIDAVNYLSSIRDAINNGGDANRAIVNLLDEIYSSPTNTWSAQLNMLCKQDGI